MSGRADWRVIITVLGWLAVIGGTFRIVFAAIGGAASAPPCSASGALPFVAGIAMLVLGGVLAYFGYRSS